MLTDLLIFIGILLALLLGYVFIMISVFYAMEEWHKNRNKCLTFKSNVNDNFSNSINSFGN